MRQDSGMAGDRAPLALIEFPADDTERALRFWRALLGVELEPRSPADGDGWQSRSTLPPVGVHARGGGPGDRFSLPYFAVDDLEKALADVRALGGSVVHPGESWAVCRDSEGTPFGLARASSGQAR
jgi:predicted enzyme related to lactoylglutathione lyase